MNPAHHKPVVLTAASLLISFCFGFAAEPPAAAQNRADPEPGLTLEQIEARMEQAYERQAADLKGYVSRRTLTLVYKGLFENGEATETVEVVYTAPSTKRFVVLSGRGSSLIRDRVFKKALESEQEEAAPNARRETALTPANYDMQLVGEERLPEGDCYVLSVSPKTKSKFAYKGKVWVQSTDFAVVRIEARPSHDPSFWVKGASFIAQKEKIGGFWLSRKTVSTSYVRLGGAATFTIDYEQYQILGSP